MAVWKPPMLEALQSLIQVSDLTLNLNTLENSFLL